MMNTLIRNALQTPDGTIIASVYQHDYKQHIDANGKLYFVDGGLHYARCSAHGDEVYLQVWSDDPHETVRLTLQWESTGTDGTEPPRRKSLAELSSTEIERALETQDIEPSVRKCFTAELYFRKVF